MNITAGARGMKMNINDIGPLQVGGDVVQTAGQQLNRVLRTRAIRTKFFDPELFADPAWDILLALYKAELSQRRVSVSSCCFDAQVPTTTGLRYIANLCRRGVVLRMADPLDGRRMFLSLSREASAAMQCILLN